jgi:hypothetical protein
MKIRPVGDELLRADVQTGRHDEADSRSSQFWQKAENMCLNIILWLFEKNIYQFSNTIC